MVNREEPQFVISTPAPGGNLILAPRLSALSSATLLYVICLIYLDQIVDFLSSFRHFDSLKIKNKNWTEPSETTKCYRYTYITWWVPTLTLYCTDMHIYGMNYCIPEGEIVLWILSGKNQALSYHFGCTVSPLGLTCLFGGWVSAGQKHLFSILKHHIWHCTVYCITEKLRSIFKIVFNFPRHKDIRQKSSGW